MTQHPDSCDHPVPDMPSPRDASSIRDDATPRIAIRFCTQCNWMLRSAWLAQELLSTFGTEIGEVALQPGTGGVFTIRLDDALLWERKRDGGFPSPKEIKRRVRDRIAPERDLGHNDR